MKRYISLLIAAVAAGALMASCATDADEAAHIGGEGEPVSIVLSTFTTGTSADSRGALTGTDGVDPDDEFSSLRVMIFRAGSMLAYNKVVDLQADGNPFSIAMTTGTYDFVFIANEDSDAALTARLDNYAGKAINNIYGESFSSAAFRNGYTIPMTGIVRNVQVAANAQGKGIVIVADETMPDPWPVEVERAAVRVDLALKTTNKNLADNFSALHLTNVPQSVPLFGKDGGGTTLYNVTGTGSFEATDPMAAYRIIGGTDGDLYDADEDTFTETADALGFVESEDETGTYYWYKRIILPSSMFTPASKEEYAIKLTAVAAGQRLSGTLGTSVLGYNAPRNQLYGLIGTLVPNRPISFTVSVRPWGENVNVELPFKLPEIPGAGTPLSERTYVGAFWKASQKGERVIRIPVDAAGTWAVQMYEYGAGFTRGDVVFSAEDTGSDQYLYTDSPRNPEDFPVTGKVFAEGTTVEEDGQDYIKFRIGLSGYYSATKTAPARYATAVIAYTAEDESAIYQKLFLRQGEGADYVMAPGDPGLSSAAARPDAVPFLPYNLTTDADISSAPFSYQVAEKGGKETAYPTQAGAIWQLVSDDYKRYAYNPVTTETPGQWGTNSNSSINWTADQEACPDGYRRPEGNNRTTGNELLQSLVATEGIADGNSLWGYYADGYFDRNTIESSVNSYAGTAVNPANVGVGYIGRLFYNPVKGSRHNASIFFPAAGYRTYSDEATLNDTGYSGNYWTYTKYNGNFGIYLSFSDNMVYAFDWIDQASGRSVRCVADEKWTPGTPGGPALTAKLVAATGATPSEEGGTVVANGTTYSIAVTSDTEWEAVVKRGTDEVATGDAVMIGKPLLDPDAGFNGGAAGAVITKTGDQTITIKPANYIDPYYLVSGTLQIVFRDKATGETLHTIKIVVTVPEYIAPRFARSNIVLYVDGDGNRILTFAEDKADHTSKTVTYDKKGGGKGSVTFSGTTALKANVQGIHFRWGGLMGMSHSCNAVSETIYDDWEDIEFWPIEYEATCKANNDGKTPDAVEWEFYKNWTAATAIPYLGDRAITIKTNTYDAFEDYFDADYFSDKSYPETTGYDAYACYGDICRYMSDKGWVKGNWRMPTRKEMELLQSETNTKVYGGIKYGISTGNDLWDYLAMTNPMDTYYYGFTPVDNARMVGGGISAGDANNTNYMLSGGPARIVLPAAGYRTNRRTGQAGVDGSYWAATSGGVTLDGEYSSLMGFNDYDFDIIAGSERGTGYSVRCIRDE